MKITAFIFWGFMICLMVASLQVKAQVNPQKMNEALLNESVEAVVDSREPVEWHKVEVPENVKSPVRKQLKIKSAVPDTIFIGKVSTANGIRFLIPDITPSRSETFSYVLYVDQNKEIVGVDVLEYRENYGYEVDYSYFREQFKGTKNPEKIIFGRTIQNISGATISARSLTYAVHDVLLILNEIQLPR